jgi:hypothetical protein
MIRQLAVVLILAGLAACTGGDVSGGPAPKQAPYLSGPITVGHWGIGPIRASTAFESDVIRELFPKAVVRDLQIAVPPDGAGHVAPGDTDAIITVTQDGVELFQIDDGDGNLPGTDDPMIGKVRALAGPVRGPLGEHLSMSWKQAGFDLSQCETGVDRDRDMVICARRGEGAVTFYFAVPGWDSEELPPISMLNKVGYLKQMVWAPTPLTDAVPKPDE